MPERQVPGVPSLRTPTSGWSRLRTASQLIWLAAVAVFVVRFAVRHGGEFLALDVDIGPQTWVLGLLLILAAKVCISLMVVDAWRAAGADVGFGPAIYTYNLSQLPKYLPGGVWPYLSRVHMVRAHNVTLPRIGGGLALETAFLLGGALVLAALAADAGPFLTGVGLDGWMPWIPWVRGLTLAFLAGAWGVAVRRSANPAAFVRATALSLVAWFFIGLSFSWVVAGVTSLAPSTEVAGLFGLAWGIGFVAVFSPAGLGVREGILGAGLAAIGSPAVVATVVVGHRLLYMAADVVCALCARIVFPPAGNS